MYRHEAINIARRVMEQAKIETELPPWVVDAILQAVNGTYQDELMSPSIPTASFASIEHEIASVTDPIPETTDLFVTHIYTGEQVVTNGKQEYIATFAKPEDARKFIAAVVATPFGWFYEGPRCRSFEFGATKPTSKHNWRPLYLGADDLDPNEQHGGC